MRTTQLTFQQLDLLISWAAWVDEKSTQISSLARMAIEALTEVKRIREDLRDGVKPLNFDSFLEKLKSKDRDLAELLADQKIVRFNLGRLSVSAIDDMAYNSIYFKKDWLAEYLTEFYGATFKVKLIRYQN